jgi:hypothetical protein
VLIEQQIACSLAERGVTDENRNNVAGAWHHRQGKLAQMSLHRGGTIVQTLSQAVRVPDMSYAFEGASGDRRGKRR